VKPSAWLALFKSGDFSINICATPTIKALYGRFDAKPARLGTAYLAIKMDDDEDAVLQTIEA